MTREEALYCIKANSVLHSEICEECPLYGDTGIDHCFEEALDMAVEALEQDPCNDAISRQAAIDAANKVIERDTSGNNDVVNAMIAWSAYIKSLPSVNPQTRTGHWIVHDHGLGCKYYQCSICKGFDRDKKRKYCKWCGAKMVEPQESEG